MPRESQICWLICRRRSSFAMLAVEVMMAIRNGLPSDVGPMLTTFIRPPLSFSMIEKYSTILSQRAILRSAPSWKPKNFSGGVI